MPDRRGFLFSRGVSASRFHRRQRISRKRLLSYIFEYLSDQLYFLGASVERGFKNTGRSFRRGSKKFFRAVWGGISFAGGALARWFLAVVSDLINPFRKFFSSLKSLVSVMRETEAKGFKAKCRRFWIFVKYGWIWNRHLLARFANHVLPVAAAAAAAVVIYGMATLNFALAVSYNGDMVGYIADEQTFALTQLIIRDRVLEGEPLNLSSGAALSVTVVSADAVMTQSEMADNLLTASGVDVAETAGLYIDGDFFGAAEDPGALGDSIDGIIEDYRGKAGNEKANVQFVRGVELRDGVYPAESLRSEDYFEELIESPVQDAVYHLVGEDEQASDVAEEHGVSIEWLRELNPGEDFEELEAGQNLLIAAEETLFSLKAVRTETLVEDIEVEEETIVNALYEEGAVFTVVEGKPGVKEVLYEIEYENGVAVKRTPVSETVVEAMQPRVVVTGMEGAWRSGGELAWPTGEFIFISRGSLGGYHIAIDIALSEGGSVFAAYDGTVVQSGWSDVGYGYYVEIDHGMVDGVPLRTLYAHNSGNLVAVGETVRMGQLIALSGNTGYSTGPHLHFEVRVNGEKVSPEPWIGLEVTGEVW